MPDVSSGWGRLTWGQAGWNEATVLTQGWGAKSWNDGEWGDLSDETITLTGLSSTACVKFADISWTSASFTARGCLIYNSTAVTGFTTNRAVCAVNFGADKTVTSGTFTVQFPAQTAGNAIVQIA